MSEQSAVTMTLTDFQIEQFVSNGYQTTGCVCCSKHTQAPAWRQYTQRAVNLIVNDWYAQPVDQRDLSLLFTLIHRHFDGFSQHFQSEAQYVELRERLIGHLDQFLLGRQQEDYPLFVFERSRLWIDELEMELSMVFQVMEQRGECLVLKRYVTDSSAQWRDAYFQMATVYCQQAFPGRLACMELLSVMNGSILKYQPNEKDYAQALDYMKLVKSLYYGQSSTQCERRENHTFVC